MKTLIIEPEFMGNISINNAFNMIFDAEIVKKAHKYSHIEVGDWNNEYKRTIVCKIIFDLIPKEARDILSQNHFDVHVCQDVVKITSPERWEINNNLQFNFPGARFFTIKPLKF